MQLVPGTQGTLMKIYRYIYTHIYFLRPLFRGCHQAAKRQCSSYRAFYVMTVYFPSLIADCLMLTGLRTPNKKSNHLPLWPCPGSLDPSKTMLPPRGECNPAHSGVPGPVRDPGQALGMSKGLLHDVQSHPQQPKWTSKGTPWTLRWQTNGQQLAMHRIIGSSYHRNRSSRGRRQGAKPFR